MRELARWTMGVGMCVAALGCGEAPPPPDGGCGSGPGTVEVGRGGSRLYDLPEGGDLPIVLGSQGGIHVLVGFRVRDMALTMAVTYRLVDEADGSVVGTPTELSLRPSLFSTSGGEIVRNPDLIVLDDESPRLEAFAGRRLRLELDAQSSDPWPADGGRGSHACDSRLVTLTAPD